VGGAVGGVIVVVLVLVAVIAALALGMYVYHAKGNHRSKGRQQDHDATAMDNSGYEEGIYIIIPGPRICTNDE
jgi:type II secretory pathway component PulK